MGSFTKCLKDTVSCFMSHVLVCWCNCWCLVAKSCPSLCGPTDSVEFPRQEYWDELPSPSLGDLPHSGIEPMSPGSAGGFFTTEHIRPLIKRPWQLTCCKWLIVGGGGSVHPAPWPCSQYFHLCCWSVFAVLTDMYRRCPYLALTFCPSKMREQ